MKNLSMETWIQYKGEAWSSVHAFTHKGISVQRIERGRPGGNPRYQFCLPNGEHVTVLSQREARWQIDYEHLAGRIAFAV